MDTEDSLLFAIVKVSSLPSGSVFYTDGPMFFLVFYHKLQGGLATWLHVPRGAHYALLSVALLILF